MSRHKSAYKTFFFSATKNMSIFIQLVYEGDAKADRDSNYEDIKNDKVMFFKWLFPEGGILF